MAKLLNYLYFYMAQLGLGLAFMFALGLWPVGV